MNSSIFSTATYGDLPTSIRSGTGKAVTEARKKKKFDGEEDPERWLREMELDAMAHEVPPGNLLFHLESLLEGRALNWWRASTNGSEEEETAVFSTKAAAAGWLEEKWGEFRKAIMDRFGEELSEADTMRTLLAVKQMRKEGVREYRERLLERRLRGIKRALRGRVALQQPREGARLVIEVDASEVGWGSILKDGERIVEMVSKKWTEAEAKHGNPVRELQAIRNSLLAHEDWLSSPFTVKTDCKALLSLHTSEFANLRMRRLQEEILGAELIFNIEHIAGADNEGADTLSRVATSAVMEIDWAEDQKEDEFCSWLRKALKEGEQALTREEKRRTAYARKHLATVDGVIKLQMEDGRQRIVVPESRQEEVVERIHEERGHAGANRLQRTAEKVFYWPRMNQTVHRVCSRCRPCLETKRPSPAEDHGVGEFRAPERPFQRVHIDHVGPFRKSRGGYKFGLVIIDAFSKWARMIPIRTVSGEETSKMLVEEWLGKYPKPEFIVADQGKAFTSRTFQQLLKKEDIDLRYSPAYRPQVNGMVERVNSTLKDAVRAAIAAGQRD